MGNKNKTISFRVNEDTFAALRDIADERDLSLSALFRDYVDALVEHDGQVRVVPEHEFEASADGDAPFPPTVEVPKGFVREHERLELESEHLREQLDEYKRYAAYLQDRLDDDGGEDVVDLDALDEEGDDEDDREFDVDADEPYQLG
ncbi:CopG family transcriptional regulator [Halobaculum sp. D14]|uniref:CopG family transcriptional regulator n=1 Tax=Halobaculum sp. D14 TaxID=3421642 RepID=UPI003EBE607D